MNLTAEEKSKLYGILKNFNKDIENTHKNWQRHTNSVILLVDGNNTFLRCWSAVPTMSANGDHTGGIVGFLKSVGYGIKLLNPTRCIVVFDGIGGSFKRKKIYPDYKERRKGHIRLNRTYEEMTDITTEEENCRHQYIRLQDYLQVLPVNILSIDHVEADDVLAYISTDYFKGSEKVYIMSSDKDFLQLCSDKVNIYSPTKKKIYGPAEVLDEYNIHPNNFVLFRALDGDESDNIPGIEGAGPKTIIKYFPFLSENNIHSIDDLITEATKKKDDYKVCERISVGKEVLDRNVKLMQLKETLLTTIAQLHINDCLETKKIPRLDRGAFIKLMMDDAMESNLPSHQSWLTEVFTSLDSVVRTT